MKENNSSGSGKKKPVILLNMAVDIHNNKECEILISQYALSVASAGGLPVLMPSIEDEALMAQYLALADGVLLIGGKDYHPKYFGEEPHEKTFLGRRRPHFDIALGEALLKYKMPVFGICAGCQLMTIVCGGKLIQHLPNAEEDHLKSFHSAVVTEEGYFSRIFQLKKGESMTVNSFHHQAVVKTNPGQGLRVTAVAFDGTVEALEGTDPDRVILGVQFHPERMEEAGECFFRALVGYAARFAGKE